MKQPEFESWIFPCNSWSAIRTVRNNIVNENITKLISIFYDFKVHISAKNSTHDDINADDVSSGHWDTEDASVCTVDVVCVGKHVVKHDGLEIPQVALMYRLE